MNWSSKEILAVLDACAGNHTFPMLDNGYVYLAASRLFLYQAESAWAMTIEIFGYSPRNGIPDLQVYTFGNRLVNRPDEEDFSHPHLFRQHRASHPCNESRFVYPVEDGPWQDGEAVAERAEEVVVRGQFVPLPSRQEYGSLGIALQDPDEVQVFELCRYLAATRRDLVLCRPDELVVNISPSMKLLLKLDEWHHPDLAGGANPGSSETFQQLAEVLATGDVSHYQPSMPANSHWRHWPDGGTL